ncbi:S9 family peptidase [Nakamurella lactea]|uniref:S9 family peptidase n=1 Tax=Nakamurella lactea TaxID=459515 RepID=UPI00041BB798|nr:alpha/beta fold hydrolase [Nakamurella lactea]
MTTADSAAPDTLADLSFPRLSARTLRFTLGEPRNVTVTADGSKVLFVRTDTGTDRTGELREFDVATGTERVLADPRELLGADGEQLSPQERARRERARESAGGVVGYTVDDAGTLAAFALSGAVWMCELASGRCTELPTAGAVIDPRIDPTGRTVAYAADGALRVIGVDGRGDRALVEPETETVVWGQAEFVAAEEMDRFRGYWWAPDGTSLLVERYDVAPVPLWYLADPADPARPPTPHRYPVAGSADAEVSLWHLTLDGGKWPVAATSEEFPYLTRVSWTGDDPVVQVLSRDQRRARVVQPHLAQRDRPGMPAGPEPTSRTARLLAEQDDEIWLELVAGVPCLAPDGRLLTTVDDRNTDTRRLVLDGAPLSPPGVQIRAVLSVDGAGALVQASAADPTSVELLRVGWDGGVTVLSSGPGVHHGVCAGDTLVISSSTLEADGSRVTVLAGGRGVGTLSRTAESAGFVPQVTLLRTGERELSTAVLFPRNHIAGSARLPVLMAPYGGPHVQLVLQHRRGFLQPQYLADQGFCVIVADGRGTPGRSPSWEKAIRDEFASVTLADQVDALAAVAQQYPDDIDPGRVGILGWSYGGYLSALAVLARPDVFHAAVAGAPVTDWELYDTFYTERYLGHPAQQPEVYRRNSLPDLVSGAALPGTVPSDPVPPNRPLLILHGMVDDNVVVAHTLRLSSALLAAGRPHSVLPLTGVTHMTPQEVVAENLLNLQVDFLRRALVERSGQQRDGR